MTTRFDKRAMGHPLPGTEDTARPSLAAFQDDITERGKRSTRAAHAAHNPTGSGEAVDALAEKVQKLDIEAGEAAEAEEDDEARSLGVSPDAGAKWGRHPNGRLQAAASARLTLPRLAGTLDEPCRTRLPGRRRPARPSPPAACGRSHRPGASHKPARTAASDAAY